MVGIKNSSLLFSKRLKSLLQFKCWNHKIKEILTWLGRFSVSDDYRDKSTDF